MGQNTLNYSLERQVSNYMLRRAPFILSAVLDLCLMRIVYLRIWLDTANINLAK